MIITTSQLPNVTLTVEAKPLPKNHVAYIASVRQGDAKSIKKEKIQSAITSFRFHMPSSGLPKEE